MIGPPKIKVYIVVFFCIVIILLLNKFVCNKRDSYSVVFRIKYPDKEFPFKVFDRSFNVFYEQFITDSSFQIERIKFPIKGEYASFEINQPWTKENWVLMTWDLKKEIENSEDSIYVDQKNDRLFFGEYCRGCGFSFEMEFVKQNNNWFLVYRQENNF